MYFKYALESDKNNEIQTAVKYYKKCVETSQDIKINPYLSSSLTNLATIYDENGKSDLAIKYLNESIRLDDITQNYNGIYISAMKLSEIYSTSSRKDKALECLKRAKKSATALNEHFYMASCEVAFGDIYYDLNDYRQALINYKEAYRLAVDNFTDENIKKIEMRINDIKKVYHEE